MSAKTWNKLMYPHFAKVGRLASEEVIVQLLKQRCFPILLYGLDVCNLVKKSMHSPGFTVNRYLWSCFRLSNMKIVKYRQNLFGCELPQCTVDEALR